MFKICILSHFIYLFISFINYLHIASSTSNLSAPDTPVTNRSHVNKNPNAETPVAKSTPKQEKGHHFSRADLYRYSLIF